MQNQQLELFNKNKSLSLKEKKEIFLRNFIIFVFIFRYFF